MALKRRYRHPPLNQNGVLQAVAQETSDGMWLQLDGEKTLRRMKDEEEA